MFTYSSMGVRLPTASLSLRDIKLIDHNNVPVLYYTPLVRVLNRFVTSSPVTEIGVSCSKCNLGTKRVKQHY